MFRISQNESPCKNCTERSQNCHTYCGRYQVFRQDSDALNAKINANKAKLQEKDSYILQSVQKTRKDGKAVHNSAW